MIQVLDRINRILDVIAEDRDGVSLKSIEEATSLNKGTLCNLLKSLCEIGYVEKKQSGIYIIGGKIKKLAYPFFQSDSFLTVAAENTRLLSEESRESGIVVTRQDNDLQVIAKEIYGRSIIINSNIFDIMPGYATAVGHIFMAFDKSLDTDEIYKQELKNKYKTKKEFNTTLQAIRKEKLFILNIEGRSSYGLAVPVFKNKELAAALAMIVPEIRYTDKRKDELIKILNKYGKKMTFILSQQHGG